MQYPNLMYKSPGSYQCPNGTFDYAQAKSESTKGELVISGYWPTIAEAVKNKGLINKKPKLKKLS